MNLKRLAGLSSKSLVNNMFFYIIIIIIIIGIVLSLFLIFFSNS